MRTLKGTLKHGVKLGDETHKDFEIRESNTGDLFDAEQDASPEQQLTYRGALLARQLTRLGSLSGPFTLAEVRKLHRDDFDLLCARQAEVDTLGKTAPGG